MPEITIYQQERKDGGLRTGVQCDGQTLLHHFQEGSEEYDPALLWFVDLRCEGEMPELSTPEEARQWLAQWSDLLHDALNMAINELSSGLDVDFQPWERSYTRSPAGWKVRVVVSAMQRFAALQIAEKLSQFSQRWEEQIGQLQPLVTA